MSDPLTKDEVAAELTLSLIRNVLVCETRHGLYQQQYLSQRRGNHGIGHGIACETIRLVRKPIIILIVTANI